MSIPSFLDSDLSHHLPVLAAQWEEELLLGSSLDRHSDSFLVGERDRRFLGISNRERGTQTGTVEVVLAYGQLGARVLE